MYSQPTQLREGDHAIPFKLERDEVVKLIATCLIHPLDEPPTCGYCGMPYGLDLDLISLVPTCNEICAVSKLRTAILRTRARDVAKGVDTYPGEID